MEGTAIVALAIIALAFAMLSKVAKGTPITAPMIFVGAGVLISGEASGFVEVEVDAEALHFVAEFTLIILLFADASRIDVRRLARGWSLPVRLLAVGMPLSVLAGVGIGVLLFPEWPIASLVVLAALLAPTDAALGQAVVEDERLPSGMRQGLSVESGLNDGIAVPIVVAGIALASGEAAGGGQSPLAFALLQVTLGPAIGIACGAAGGMGLEWAESKNAVEGSQKAIAGVALAALAFSLAEAVGGNGFISVFVAGMTAGAAAPTACSAFHSFVENEGQALMFLVFVLVGSIYAIPVVESVTGPQVLYALLALTVMRMVPVLISLIGSGFGGLSQILIAWFGPRGIASIVFAIVALESEGLPMRHEIFTIAIVTVLMSVFAHGVTAAPAAALYSKVCKPGLAQDAPEFQELPHD